MRLRCLLYRSGLIPSYRAPVPVISVGNIVVGGTGKTPMVDFLARYVSGLGVRCAIVSRGFGGNYRQAVARVMDADGKPNMTAAECGDEPYLLARRNPLVPVFVARQRKLGVRAAVGDGARLILLDDGFQHLAVRRDLDIVLLDAQRPFGNGRMLPAGVLREPRSALRRAGLVVMTRADQAEGILQQFSSPVLRSSHRTDRVLRTLDGEVVAESDYAGKSCLAFAGIARPREFFQSLRSFGFSRIEEVAFADHQQYNRDTLNRLIGSCNNHDLLLTTEKDAVKLSQVDFPIPCYQVGVQMVFDDPSFLEHLLEETLAQFG